MGHKSPDHFGVYACSDCHEWLDRHKGEEIDRLFYSLRALGRTHKKMIELGVMKIG